MEIIKIEFAFEDKEDEFKFIANLHELWDKQNPRFLFKILKDNSQETKSSTIDYLIIGVILVAILSALIIGFILGNMEKRHTYINEEEYKQIMNNYYTMGYIDGTNNALTLSIDHKFGCDKIKEEKRLQGRLDNINARKNRIMIKVVCSDCGKEIEGYNGNHANSLLSHHKLKHKELIAV